MADAVERTASFAIARTISYPNRDLFGSMGGGDDGDDEDDMVAAAVASTSTSASRSQQIEFSSSLMGSSGGVTTLFHDGFAHANAGGVGRAFSFDGFADGAAAGVPQSLDEYVLTCFVVQVLFLQRREPVHVMVSVRCVKELCDVCCCC